MVDDKSDTVGRRIIALFLNEGTNISSEALDMILTRDNPIEFTCGLLNYLKDLKDKPIILTSEEISRLSPSIRVSQEKTEIQKRATTVDESPHQKEASPTRNEVVEGPLPLRKGKYTVRRRGYTVRLEIKKTRRKTSSR